MPAGFEEIRRPYCNISLRSTNFTRIARRVAKRACARGCDDLRNNGFCHALPRNAQLALLAFVVVLAVQVDFVVVMVVKVSSVVVMNTVVVGGGEEKSSAGKIL
jgi:hypothetical protein